MGQQQQVRPAGMAPAPAGMLAMQLPQQQGVPNGMMGMMPVQGSMMVGPGGQMQYVVMQQPNGGAGGMQMVALPGGGMGMVAMQPQQYQPQQQQPMGMMMGAGQATGFGAGMVMMQQQQPQQQQQAPMPAPAASQQHAAAFDDLFK